MTEYYFVKENSNRYRIKIFLFFIASLLILLTIGLVLGSTIYKASHASLILDVIKKEINNFTPLGVFYAHLIGGIFIIPSPDELIFYYGLTKGNSIFLTFFSAMIGYHIAQVFNYFAGFKLNYFFKSIVSKKKFYKSRRYINKYGPYGILFFNIIPLPGSFLTFALGLARYNVYRLFLFTIIGKTLKYGVIILFYVYIRT